MRKKKDFKAFVTDQVYKKKTINNLLYKLKYSNVSKRVR